MAGEGKKSEILGGPAEGLGFGFQGSGQRFWGQKQKQKKKKKKSKMRKKKKKKKKKKEKKKEKKTKKQKKKEQSKHHLFDFGQIRLRPIRFRPAGRSRIGRSSRTCLANLDMLSCGPFGRSAQFSIETVP